MTSWATLVPAAVALIGTVAAVATSVRYLARRIDHLEEQLTSWQVETAAWVRRVAILEDRMVAGRIRRNTPLPSL